MTIATGVSSKTAHGSSFLFTRTLLHALVLTNISCAFGAGFQHVSIPTLHKTLLPGKFLAKEVPLLVVVIFIAVFMKGLY